MFSCISGSKYVRRVNFPILRTYSNYTIKDSFHATKANNRYIKLWNKGTLFSFHVKIGGVPQQRPLSHVPSEAVAQSPMVLKFLSESSPVLFAQESLVYFHDVTCLPWWATIVAATVILRTMVTLPLAVYQNYVLARYENILQEMPAIVKELKAETAFAVKKFNWTENQAKVVYNRSVRKQLKKLIIRDNCHPLKASLLLWIQIPMWICLSASLRNLVYMLPHHTVDAQMTFMQLSEEGCLWISNLIAADSTFVLPIAFGLTNLAIIELVSLSKLKTPGKLQKFITNFFRLLTLGMMAIATQVPSCLTLYWLTSSVYGLVQNVVLMSPRVKKFCRIPETPTQLKHPYKHVYTRLTEKAKKLRI